MFPLALTEAHNVEPSVLAELLRRRLHRMRGELAYLESGLASVAERGLDEAYWLDLTYLRDLLAAQITWVERTVARLESGELAWRQRRQGRRPRRRQIPDEHPDARITEGPDMSTSPIEQPAATAPPVAPATAPPAAPGNRPADRRRHGRGRRCGRWSSASS